MRLFIVICLVLMPIGLLAGELEKSAEGFLKAADQGSADGQFALGAMYYEGEGVAQDHKEALKWFLKAANRGFAKAQASLGAMYERGTGVTQNLTEAVKWYRKAADQGHAGAQCNLGVMYATGEGITQDVVQAHMWFDLARSGGYADAVQNRERVAAKMTPDQKKKAQDMAREKAAEISKLKSTQEK